MRRHADSDTIGMLTTHALVLAALGVYESAEHAPHLVCTMLFAMAILQAWHVAQLWYSPDPED